MNNEVNAKLVLKHAISKDGKPYDYVSVQFEGAELERLFLKPLEIKYMFNTEHVSAFNGDTTVI